MQVIRFKKTVLSLLILLAILVVLLRTIYLQMDFSYITRSTTQTELLQTQDPSQETSSKLDDKFLVNTLGCKMTRLPVMTSLIQKFFVPPDPIDCSPPSITESDESSLWINLNQEQLQKFYNITDLSLLKCHYQPFIRLLDRLRHMLDKKVQLSYGKKYPISDEFIRVECFNGSETIFLGFHSFLPKKPEVAKRVYKKMLNESKHHHEEKLNVMILGIDTVSRLNFHRLMKKSKRTLDKLGGIEFLGYNKVADNTFPNLIPLLTGLNVTEFDKNRVEGVYDKCHFIWQDFVSKGYQTVYGEDCSYVGLFTMGRPGFRNQPADYFLNTFFEEIEHNIYRSKNLMFYDCLGDKKPVEILFNYIEKLIETKKDDKIFSFFWTSTMTHEFINYPTLLDDDLSNLLIKMEDKGFLNKTFLLLLSDHGARFGDFRETNQGMIEERQPLLYFVLPKWFKQTYPEAHKNLMINTRRLTTPFDIYKTLQDLSTPEFLKNVSIQSRLKQSGLLRSTSLFLQVSPNRTCETAEIASHWCTCFDRKEISITDERTQNAATFVVEYINDLLKNYTKCTKLSLNSVLFANLEVSSNNFNVDIERNQTLYDIIIGVETKPSMAKFEATVRFPVDGSDKLQILGTISRINKYRNQSHCIDENKLKLYCFCIT